MSDSNLINELISEVADRYKIKVSDIKSRKRHKIYAEARAVISYILYYKIELSYPKIGKILDRNHATIIYFVKNADNWLRYPASNTKGYNILDTLLQEVSQKLAI